MLATLREILAKAGSSLEQVVKARVFITNMDDFPEVNKYAGSDSLSAH